MQPYEAPPAAPFGTQVPPSYPEGEQQRRNGVAASSGAFDLPYDFADLLGHGTSLPPAQHDPASQQQLLDLLAAVGQGTSTAPPVPGQNAFAHFAEMLPYPTPTAQSYGQADPLTAIAGFNGGQPAPEQFNTFRGTSTGSSAFSIDGAGWDDHEFAFTPLVSPAMTPLSALLSPQLQGLKSANGNAHVSPAEVFSPLTSPALRPQDAVAPNRVGAGGAQQQDSPNYAMMNEQTSNLGLDNFQLPRSHGASPVMGPTRPSNGGGHGRGASRTSAKARPSPIMKPTRPSKNGAAPLTPIHPPESTASTPSPLDIDVSMAVAHSHDLMPPPPLPSHAPVPATPSSMMNLGPELSQPYAETESSSPNLAPRRTGRKTAKDPSGRQSSRNSVEFAPIASTSSSAQPDDRRNSHRAAEQRRRDSLKLCFEELRPLLPHIPPEEDEEAAATKRPGEGNVAGQRTAGLDPRFPNKGVSKVALLRKSNAYIASLERRIAARNKAISDLCQRFNVSPEEITIDDWEDEWPWNGAPGDEGHSPYANGGDGVEEEDDRPTKSRTSTRRTSRRDSMLGYSIDGL